MTRERRFILLDRDGTIIVERHYLADPDQVELIPGVSETLRQLRSMGLGLVIVTNQSGIGRGFFDQRRLELIHQRLCGLLRAEGVELDGIYSCPHVPEEGCYCRKPHIALIERAAKELGFKPEESFVIGDKVCDIEMGKRVGATTLLVLTGYGVQVASEGEVSPDYVIEEISAAVPLIRSLLADGKRITQQ